MVLAVEGLVGWLQLLGPLLHAGSTYQAENKIFCYSSLLPLVLNLSSVSLLIEPKHKVAKHYLGKDAKVVKSVLLIHLLWKSSSANNE